MRPLQPPNHYQRIGWLVNQSAIRCEVGLDDFLVGGDYTIAHTTINLARSESRPRNGRDDTVHVAGDSQVFFIWDRHSRAHAFAIKMPKFELQSLNDVPIWQWHTFADLIRHFALPEVPCVAEADPGAYYGNLSKLSQLETHA